MNRGTIFNASNVALNVRQGTVPDVSGALKDWFQLMTFIKVEKSTVAFQDVETATPINFWGVIQPLNTRQLMLKPEGQRAWTWLTLHAEPSLKLQVDDVVVYLGKQTRVMSNANYGLYGFLVYELVQDFTGAGP